MHERRPRPLDLLTTTPSTPSQRVRRWGRRVGLALGAAALLSQSIACQTRYDSGMEAIAEQRWADARREASAGLREHPNDPAYRLLMARALTDEAVGILHASQGEEAGQTASDQSAARKRFKRALPHAKAAFESGRFDAEAGQLLGHIYWNLEAPIEVIEPWRRAA